MPQKTGDADSGSSYVDAAASSASADTSASSLENEKTRKKYTPEDFLNAIKSIPSYVETSDVFMILAPIVEEDDKSKVHSFSSWYFVFSIMF